MENLIFSLNATVPVFLMMVLGLIFKKIGWIDDVFAAKMNKFVFTVPLPVLVFSDLATVDFSQVWDVKFVLFCFVVTLLSIAISALISFLWKDRSDRVWMCPVLCSSSRTQCSWILLHPVLYSPPSDLYCILQRFSEQGHGRYVSHRRVRSPA